MEGFGSSGLDASGTASPSDVEQICTAHQWASEAVRKSCGTALSCHHKTLTPRNSLQHSRHAAVTRFHATCQPFPRRASTSAGRHHLVLPPRDSGCVHHTIQANCRRGLPRFSTRLAPFLTIGSPVPGDLRERGRGGINRSRSPTNGPTSHCCG